MILSRYVQMLRVCLLHSLKFYFGKPIIATPVGSIPDIVFNDYNGYIVNKEEIDKIAAELV